MTLAMLGMMWRGEAWKAAFLQIGQQAPRESQLQQQSSSKTGFYCLGRLFHDGELRHAGPSDGDQSQPLIGRVDREQVAGVYDRIGEYDLLSQQKRRENGLNLRETGPGFCQG